MRALMGVCVAALLSSAAQAQVISLDQMIAFTTQQCIAQSPGQPDAPRFCTCWVRHWVGLWDANDRVVWSQTGQATPHMQEMERQAASDCRGG